MKLRMVFPTVEHRDPVARDCGAVEGGRHPFSDLDWPRQMLTEATFAERDGRATITLRWLPLDATGNEIEVFNSPRSSMTQGWTGTFEHLTQYLTTCKI